MAMIASASGDYLSDFEISDLTLDCNLQRAPDLFPEILGSGTVKADASGATLTSSAAFFTPEMLGRTIAFENNTTARIMAVTSGTTVTLDSSFTFSALTFKVLGLQTLDSGTVTASASGTTITSSAAFFTNDMPGRTHFQQYQSAHYGCNEFHDRYDRHFPEL